MTSKSKLPRIKKMTKEESAAQYRRNRDAIRGTKYRIVIQWRNPPTPTELAMLNCAGNREGTDRDLLVEQMHIIMKTMRNVQQCSIEEFT
jgi:hypothetical protein